MNKYLVIVEKTETGYSEFSPDLPECVATGKNQDEVEQAMRDAIQFHLDGMREDGEIIPVPHSYSTYCEVSA
jgi:predicted RNase H-like HicB family nuclease